MDELSAIPARTLPVSATAPGKCILFGEHAVVHGAPELAVAIDLTTQVVLTSSEVPRLNGDAAAAGSHPYLPTALRSLPPPGGSVDVRVVSRIPRSAGLGSSAAFCASLAVGLGAVRGGVSRAAIAQAAFDIERGSQGVGSPGDTSTSVAGGYVSLNGGPGAVLWTIRGGERAWEVRRVSDPGWVWVVAHSGIPRSTADAVRAVTARLGRADGPELLRRFESVARAGIDAVERGDRDEAARQMVANQALLREVGVSHPRLEALLEAAAPAALGAKLTGAGAGGSIVALARPGEETDLVRRLARAGGLPFVVRPRAGAELVDAPAPNRS